MASTAFDLGRGFARFCVPLRWPRFVLLFALASCGDDQDPAGASRLWSEIHGANFRAWERAPGYPTRRASFTAHANAVEIFVNPEIQRVLAGPEPATEWPAGSIVVKEGYASPREDAARSIVAVMKKDAALGWFWAEYDTDGEVLYSGRPHVCVDCHDHRAAYSDWVYAFELPR